MRFNASFLLLKKHEPSTLRTTVVEDKGRFVLNGGAGRYSMQSAVCVFAIASTFDICCGGTETTCDLNFAFGASTHETGSGAALAAAPVPPAAA
jgi:hypothetical protein